MDGWLATSLGILGSFLTGGTLIALLQLLFKSRTDDRTWLFDRLRANADEANVALKEARTEMEAIRRTNVRVLLENVELKTTTTEKDLRIATLEKELRETQAHAIATKEKQN